MWGFAASPASPLTSGAERLGGQPEPTLCHHAIRDLAVSLFGSRDSGDGLGCALWASPLIEVQYESPPSSCIACRRARRLMEQANDTSQPALRLMRHLDPHPPESVKKRVRTQEWNWSPFQQFSDAILAPDRWPAQ